MMFDETKEEVSFVAWLQREMNLRSWTATDLARRADLQPSTITRILNGQREPGADALQAIAVALNERPERVFKLAGVISEIGQVNGLNENEEELVKLYRSLATSRQVAILEIVRGLFATQTKKGR